MSEDAKVSDPFDFVSPPPKARRTYGVATWQPIETAPRDYSNVLVVDEGVVYEAYFEARNGKWWMANTDEHDYTAKPLYPTHWMPLPAPPEA